MVEQLVNMSHAQSFPTPLEKVTFRDGRQCMDRLVERGWLLNGRGLCGIRGADGRQWFVEPRRSGLSLGAGIYVREERQGGTINVMAPEHMGRIAVMTALWQHLPHSPKVIVHAYPTMTMKWSQKGQVFVFSHHDYASLLGASLSTEGIKVTIVPKDVSSVDLAHQISLWCHPELPVLVHAGGGVFSWASEFDQAIRQIEAIEYLCQSY